MYRINEEEIKDTEIVQDGGKLKKPIKNNLLQKKRGKKAVCKGALYPDLIEKAKLILLNHNYDRKKLLEMEEFKHLKGTIDLDKYLSKYILN